jgi:hypothetical protein
MRLLTSVDTSEEADRIQQLFDASGVPVFIEADYTRSNPAERPGTFGYRVHIFVDEQEHDARKLLLDPDYELVKPIDCQGFYDELDRVEQERKERVPQQVDRAMNWLVTAGIVGLLAFGAWKVTSSS